MRAEVEKFREVLIADFVEHDLKPSGQVNVETIVKKFLEVCGYDGLYDPGECACLVDDLFPCGMCNSNGCLPGYKSEVTEETSFRRSDGYDFIVGPDKPDQKSPKTGGSG
jgi:hypothetical protein